MNLIRKNTSTIPMFDVWDDFFGRDWMNISKKPAFNYSMPAVNIKESDDGYNLELAVPGMKKEDFKIEMENDMLIISVERKDEQQEKEADYTKREFHYHSFKRSFTLPKEIDVDRIAASYTDGILNVAIPKKEEAKAKLPKLIDVA